MRHRLAAVLLLLSFVVACHGTARKGGVLEQQFTAGVTAEKVRGATFEYGRHAMLVIEAVADSIVRSTDVPADRVAAIRWMADAVPNIREAVLRPDPAIALLDITALMMQYRRYFESGEGRDRMGAGQGRVLALHRTLEEEITRIVEGSGMATRGDTSWAKLERWVDNHPMTGNNYLRESIAFAARDFGGSRGAGALGAVGSMDESIRLINERLRFLEEPLFKEVGWKAELMLADLSAAPGVNALTEPIRRLPALMDSVPAIADGLLDSGFERLALERAAVFREIDAQRLATLDAIAGEREAVLLALASERGIVVEALRTERLAAFRDLEQMRQATMLDLQRLVDHTIWRIFQMLLALGALLLVGVLAVLLVLRRPAARG